MALATGVSDMEVRLDTPATSAVPPWTHSLARRASMLLVSDVRVDL